MKRIITILWLFILISSCIPSETEPAGNENHQFSFAFLAGLDSEGKSHWCFRWSIVNKYELSRA